MKELSEKQEGIVLLIVMTIGFSLHFLALVGFFGETIQASAVDFWYWFIFQKGMI